MSDDTTRPDPDVPDGAHRHPDATSQRRDEQITTLHNLITELGARIERAETQLNRLSKTVRATPSTPDTHTADEDEDPSAPAPWLWFTAPAATEDTDSAGDPRQTITNFIAWYNTIYAGTDSGRAAPIPDCWHQHPGLAAELATLAYSWRAANLGPHATIRDAMHWHHQWRPGLIDRLHRDWIHPDCFTGQHRPSRASPRPDRHTLAARTTPRPDGANTAAGEANADPTPGGSRRNP